LGGRMPKKKIEKEASKKHPMENNEGTEISRNYEGRENKINKE
jgi:hypothetical protein